MTAQNRQVRAPVEGLRILIESFFQHSCVTFLGAVQTGKKSKPTRDRRPESERSLRYCCNSDAILCRPYQNRSALLACVQTIWFRKPSAHSRSRATVEELCSLNNSRSGLSSCLGSTAGGLRHCHPATALC